MRFRTFLLSVAALLSAGTLLSAPAMADPKDRDRGAQGEGRRGDRDKFDKAPSGWGKPDLGSNWSPDEAREAVREGRHRPLRDVLRGVRNQIDGEMVDVQGLEERGGGRAVYRIRWRTPDGRLLDLRVDAETGQVMR